MDKDPNPRGSGADADPDESQFLNELQKLIQAFSEKKLAGEDQEAMAAALSALILAGEESLKHPTPELMLMEQANQLERVGDWVGAEQARREVLQLKATEGNPGMVAKAYADLSHLFRLRGRGDEAWEAALAATKAARRSGFELVLAMMLENEACCAYLRGDPDRALQAADEGLGVVEVSRLTAGIRSRLTAARARCLAVKCDWPATEKALARARELIDKDGWGGCCPGPISTDAACWEVEAALRSGRGDGAGAVEAWLKAVERRRRLQTFEHLQGPYTLMALAKALEGLGQALAECGCADEAALNREEAVRLRGRIERGCAPGDVTEGCR